MPTLDVMAHCLPVSHHIKTLLFKMFTFQKTPAERFIRLGHDYGIIISACDVCRNVHFIFYFKAFTGQCSRCAYIIVIH